MRSFRDCARSAIGGIAWPTIALSVLSLAGFLAVTGAAVAGILPAWAAGLLNIPCFFVAYTGFHETVHGNLHGNREGCAWLNPVLGTALGAIFFYPYVVHAYIHLTHHAHTNDPDLDPDAWMSGNTVWRVAGRGMSLIGHYIAFMVRRRAGEPGARRFFRRAYLEWTPPVLALALLIAAGHWQVALFSWVLSYIVSVAILGVCFDWIVHHPHDDRSLFGGTRTFRARKGWRRPVLNWLHLFQNYHIIHHMYPRVPFYKHEEVFERSEAFLRGQGARIIEL